MTRKLLSGVLAFAMVFGCTAPVALAEDTTVEEVEQYTVYAPSLSASSVTLNKAGDTATVTVNDVAADAEVDLNGNTDFSATLKDKVLTITAVNDVAAEGATLKIDFKSADANGKDDYYTNSVTLKVVKGSATKDTIVPEIDDDAIVDDMIRAGKSIIVTVYGRTVDADDTDTVVKTGAPAVTAELSESAKKFYTLSTKEYTDPKTKKVAGTILTITATTAMTTDEIVNLYIGDNAPAVRVSAKYGTATYPSEKWILPPVLAANEKAPQSISLAASTTSTTVGTEVKLAAKVMVDDGFGGVVADDKASVVWYVNGIKIGSDYTYKDAIGKELATLKPSGSITAAEFTATAPGTYKITVETADGSCIANRTITVASNVTLDPGTTDAPSLPWAYTTDITKKEDTIKKVTKVGGTVDLSTLKFGAWGTDKKEYPISTFNGVATLKIASVTAGTEKLTDGVAKKIVTIKDGVVSIADATDATMAEVLKVAGKKDIIVTLTADVKYTATDTRPLYNTITITVTKSTADVAKVVYTIGDKEINKDSDGNYTKTLSMPVLTVGKTVDVNATLYDKNDFTDGINQGIIWEIQNTDPADKNVYATVDANGVVTPVAKCTGKAELVAVPVADTTKVAKGTLYIMEDPTATVAPTAAPTAAPTQAPETKTGTVNTSSSALNIRAAASTTAGVVTKAAKGSTVTILGEENGFYKVKLADGTIGYASKAYIKVTTDTPVVTITATTTANLKLRTSAPSGSVITVMPKGATVKVIEGGQSWAKVEYNGKVGYASNNYLTFNTVG